MLKPVLMMIVLCIVPAPDTLAQECVHGPKETSPIVFDGNRRLTLLIVSINSRPTLSRKSRFDSTSVRAPSSFRRPLTTLI